jgi:FMN phosphatase YigB (HAD superfamily)
MALQQSGTTAEHSVFIDDQPRNCDGARAAGWQAIHFTGATAAITALDRVIDNSSQGKELQ